MHIARQRTRSAGMMLAFVGVAALLAAGCDQPRTSARPSPSLVEIDVSHPPSVAPAASVAPTTQATFVSIPVGWDTSFCGVMADAVVAQETVIDIERAWNEEAFRDARGLAKDLRDITADATGILGQLPAWDSAADATAKLSALITLGAQAAEQYGIAFENSSDSALRKARGFRREIGRQTPDVNTALAGLGNLGIDCDSTPLHLETF
jgi:hypothetical protein